MFKVRYLLLFLFFLFLAPKAQAEINVIDTEFFNKIILDSVNFTLLDWDKDTKQWVVDWQFQDDIYTLALYPGNSTASFSLSSHQSWFMSTDQINWQPLSTDKISVNKIYLKKVTVDDGGQIKILDKDTDAQVTEFLDFQNPENFTLISKVYQINTSAKKINLEFYYNSDNDWHKQIYAYNPSLATWEKLDGYNNVEAKYIRLVMDHTLSPLYLAVFEDQEAYDGIASYYDQSRYKAFGKKNGLFVASRYYPKGTKLKITRLKTGKSIVVTVNDFGPESRTGRLADLDKYAFKQIASLGAGVIYVKVEPI